MDNCLSCPAGAGNTPTSLAVTDLPDDVLFIILKYLDKQSLGRLSRVCKIFYFLIGGDCVWLRHSRRSTIVQARHLDNTRVTKHLSLKEQCRTSYNWTEGHFRDVILARHSSRQLPWVQLNEDCLWMSTRNEIKCYSRRKAGFRENKRRRLTGVLADISRFRSKDGVIAASCRDGSVCGWHTDNGEHWFYCDRLHTGEAQCVDFYDNTIISGSRDKTVKVVTVNSRHGDKEGETIICDDRVWSLSVCPDGSSFAVGTSGCCGDSALSLFDLNSCNRLQDLPTGPRRGAGVLDIQFDSPHTLLSCGYDTFLRLWDTRTGTCVSSWEEPFDSALYCVQSDQCNVMVTGTARHGMSRLWDKRQTEPLQQYYCGLRSSPVYSLAFDQTSLYVALDLSLHLLDFSVFSQ
ncbi:F-box/WD repeat-containing protein 4-like isoform X2 [Liolophura sinensis]|uniref:F-box/WD repeat-containing protein 4-like isoform X2 n=1 Tax=Liolophura sinensis TaxID=3198878 RepID=UPI003159656D